MAVDARKHHGSVAVRMDMDLGGVLVPVEVTVTSEGLAIRGVGRRFSLRSFWLPLIRRMPLPPAAPASCLADPAKLLTL